MSAAVPRMVLASASSRRRAILTRLGLTFEVQPSPVEASRAADESPVRYALRAATGKMLTVGALVDDPRAFVLGADTIVVLGNSVLGKPADDEDAESMLERLSGQWHDVTTGVALGRPGVGMLGRIAISTAVRFRRLTEWDIGQYVGTGEGRDKAGAYAMQGAGRSLVAEVRGSRSNVVGLPAMDTLLLLAQHGAIRSWP